MSLATDRYKYFDGAVAAELISIAALVSFCGHSSSAPKIFKRDAVAEVQPPSVTFSVVHEGSILPDVDDGIFQSVVQVDHWHTDRLQSMDALGATENHFAQDDVSGNDKAIIRTRIKSVGVRVLNATRVGLSDPDDPDVYVSTARIQVRWVTTA